MKKNFFPGLAGWVLMLAMLACALPGSGGSEEQTTTDDVATIVAATFQALTPSVTDAPTAIPTPTGLLPHALYFLNNDGAGLAQVFRLATDGVTVTQLTFEPAAVDSYDVSRVDGSVVYISNNQLLLVNADGSGRRLLVDGGPVDVNNPFATSLSNPAFSPAGETIAYGDEGLVLYSLASGVANVVLSNKVTDPATGVEVVRELYLPEKYSPDGSKILLTVAIPNSDGIGGGVYYPSSNTLIRFTSSDAGFALCCGEPTWSLDGSALFTANASVGMFGSGLWQISATSGNTTTLLPFEAGGGNYNLADEPYLAPDGQLYFFYGVAPIGPEGFIENGPLQIVRSAPDGVTSRTVLRPEIFRGLNEALWSPSADFVIVAVSSSAEVLSGGALQLYYTDASKAMIPLASFGRQLKWGP